MAEKERFELSMGVNPYALSRGAPLRVSDCVLLLLGNSVFGPRIKSLVPAVGLSFRRVISQGVSRNRGTLIADQKST